MDSDIVNSASVSMRHKTLKPREEVRAVFGPEKMQLTSNKWQEPEALPIGNMCCPSFVKTVNIFQLFLTSAPLSSLGRWTDKHILRAYLTVVTVICRGLLYKECSGQSCLLLGSSLSWSWGTGHYLGSEPWMRKAQARRVSSCGQPAPLPWAWRVLPDKWFLWKVPQEPAGDTDVASVARWVIKVIVPFRIPQIRRRFPGEMLEPINGPQARLEWFCSFGKRLALQSLAVHPWIKSLIWTE